MVPYRKILVSVDFSDDSAAALEHAIGIARGFGASIELLHSYPVSMRGFTTYGVPFPETLQRDWREAAERKLAAWGERVEQAGVPVTLVLTHEPASHATVQHAEASGADLIVMGTRGLSGLKHVLLGSVAERTLRHAPCPVLTVRAERPARGSG